MKQGVEELYSKIQTGPAILFLGQDYLRLESGVDPFLAEVLRKYSGTDINPSSYSQIIDSEASEAGEAAIAWMYERCNRLSPPQWLEVVAKVPWNGVYTSAIDVIWPKVFQTDWRGLQPVLEENQRQSDPRNPLTMYCTYLFGSVSRAELEVRPPLTRFEWFKRKQVAVTLARRLPEIITPLGVLLIEGYAGERDWFNPDELFPIIDQLRSGQAHVFSVSEELERNPFISYLVEQNKMVLHREHLSVYLLRGETGGFLKLGKKPEEILTERRIQLESNLLAVPRLIWNQVSKSATILDDTILLPTQPISKEKRYSEFRNFLSDSSVRPLWSGYRQGFSFTRDYEKKLLLEVNKRLHSTDLQVAPVIVHGQTGTGKTVALGALAYKVRDERRYPVLFIERKQQRPLNTDIDAFCKWAEDMGASTTLVVWDGMGELDQYYDLIRYLTGRGRKVVLVGSSYHLDPKVTKKDHFIEAQSFLNEDEVKRFTDFLNTFDPYLGDLLRHKMDQKDKTFLVALYRILPPTRSMLRSGVVREFGIAEQDIRKKIADQAPDSIIETSLGQALLKAGLLDNFPDISTEDTTTTETQLGELETLIGLVMVPGRFGLPVPIDLLLRSLGKDSFEHLVTIMQQVDIFRWPTNNMVNIVVSPRHPLEAQLFTQARLGGPKAEVEFASKLLLAIRDNGLFSGGDEVQFAVDLVRSMGPKGQDNRFVPYFGDLSRALSKVREERGVENTRLMLQEATLLREFVVHSNLSGRQVPDAEQLLERAEVILRLALDVLGKEDRNNKFRSVLLVELSATLGSRARHIIDHSSHPADALMYFEEAREQLVKARILDADSYYPLDILAWTTIDLINAGILDSQLHAEIEVDVISAFETAQAENFGFVQREKFQTRRMELGKLLGRIDLSENAFAELLAQGSTAGYYLRAKQITGTIPDDSQLTDTQRENCHKAAEYLEQNRDAIRNDGRCLYLLLRLWWQYNTGKPIFYRERQTLPFTQQQWQYCATLIQNIMSLNDTYRTLPIKYLEGIANFHLGYIENAFEIFRELERDSENMQGPRRIIRSYLSSTPDGHPKTYDGTVDWVNDTATRGEVYVEELRRPVRFIPKDFNRRDFHKYEAITEFYIAFNFRGPIVDPIGYLKK